MTIPDRGRVADLVARGLLQEGETVWLRKEAMACERWHLYDSDHLAFRSVVARDDRGAVRLRWQPSPEAPAELIHPIDMTFRVYQTLWEQMPDWSGKAFKPRAVLTCFTKGREGLTLQALASTEDSEDRK